MSPDTLTAGQALRQLTGRFATAGLDTPDLDARLLLAHVLHIDQLRLVTAPETLLSTTQLDALERAAGRRLAHEPVSRIIGERWFYGRPYRITSATLDPRPDSETLIDAVLAHVRLNDLQQSPLRLLDIGTGTGCLLLTLLAELPAATGVGSDLSAAALAVAQLNADRLGIASNRVKWTRGDGFTPITGIFNVILSNPPYIPSREIAGLAPDVRNYDPRLALDGGPDGLNPYREFSKQACKYIDKTGGYLIYEIGAGQHDAVADLLHQAPWPQPVTIETFSDLGGIVRCVAANTRPQRPR
jgi:release factor glutamine methyltransferase